MGAFCPVVVSLSVSVCVSASRPLPNPPHLALTNLGMLYNCISKIRSLVRHTGSGVLGFSVLKRLV